jgi:Protein of unknown function (DUF295)
MEARKDVEREWSSLPPEVLNLIAKYLYEIIDFVRFRAVSIAWRSSTPITDLPPQFPWICEDRYDIQKPDLRFFSMSSNKIYTIHAAKSMNKRLCEPCNGYYLAKIEDNNYNYRLSHLSLLNPLNNDDEILLPACDYGIPFWFGHGVNQIGKYMVSCASVRMDDEIILFYCRPGQEYWCERKLDIDFMSCYHYFHKGMLFTVEADTGVTKVTDITNGTLVYVVPPIKDYLLVEHSQRFQLVELSGDILGIFVPVSQESEYLNDVFHLDISNIGFPCWVKVKYIGDYAIFMDSSCCFMLKANDLAGIKANCIYALKEKYERLSRVLLHEVERIDIETGARERIRCPFQKVVRWFVPNLRHLCTQ